MTTRQATFSLKLSNPGVKCKVCFHTHVDISTLILWLFGLLCAPPNSFWLLYLGESMSSNLLGTFKLLTRRFKIGSYTKEWTEVENILLCCGYGQSSKWIMKVSCTEQTEVTWIYISYGTFCIHIAWIWEDKQLAKKTYDLIS